MIALPFSADAPIETAVSFDNAIQTSRLRLQTTVENSHVYSIAGKTALDIGCAHKRLGGDEGGATTSTTSGISWKKVIGVSISPGEANIISSITRSGITFPNPSRETFASPISTPPSRKK